jgi:hypothetical protein
MVTAKLMPVSYATFPITKLLRCLHQLGRIQFPVKPGGGTHCGILTLYLFHLETTVKYSLPTFSEVLVDFSEGLLDFLPKKSFFA